MSAVSIASMRAGVTLWPRSSSSRVEDRRGVAHAPSEHVLVRERAPELAEVGAERRPAPRRLETDEPACARGNADRATHVVAVRDGNHAGRHGGGGAAAGTARGVVETPRVVRRAVRERLR